MSRYSTMKEEELLRHAKLGNGDPAAGDLNDGFAEREMRRRGYTKEQIEHARQGRKKLARLTKEQKRDLKERRVFMAKLDLLVADVLPKKYSKALRSPRVLGYRELKGKAQPSKIYFLGTLVQFTKARLMKEYNIGRKAVDEIEKMLNNLGLKFRMKVEGWEKPL